VKDLPRPVRWVAYAPRGLADGRRVAAADEDAFTMAASALELARAAGGEPPSLERIELVGDFPPVADWGFSALLGHPVKIARHPAGAAAFRSVLEGVLEEGPTGTGWAVMTADLPERGGESALARPSAIGAAAVAVVGAGGARIDPATIAPFEGPACAVDAAIAAARSARRAEPDAWVGDWSPDPAQGRPVDLASVLAAASPPLSAVSEGAYVPRARYVENLPSRWRFVAEECDVCGSRTFPARGACVRCGERWRLRPTVLPTEGATVVASTVIGKGGQPTEFDAQVAASGAYGVVLAELAPGARVTLQVTDSAPEALAIGSRIGTRLRRLYPMEGEWRYGRKAVPLAGPSSRA